MPIEIHAGDIIRYHRNGVGLYRCQVVAIHDDPRLPLLLRPMSFCATAHPVRHRAFRAGLSGVRSVEPVGDPALASSASSRSRAMPK